MKSASAKKPAPPLGASMEQKAEEVSRLLAAMANAKRLLVLCHLLEGEKPVGELADIVGLSSAALSQHLARMRAMDLVTTRREGQSIYYQLASQEIREVLATLYRLYCAPDE
jgi:DNA-binding transcriptional ArsR family regulator